MPYRLMDDGRLVAQRMENRPRRGVACPPAGCGPSRYGMGADEPPQPVAQFAPAAPAAPPPSLSRADAVALASGARIGDRAARYAIQVVQGRGLAGGVGLGRSADTAFWKVDRIAGLEVVFGEYVEGYFTDDPTGKTVVMGNDGNWRLSVGQEFEEDQFDRLYNSPDWTYIATLSAGAGAPAPSGGGFPDLSNLAPSGGGFPDLSNLARQGVDIYRVFSDKGPATPRPPAPRPSSGAGASTGTILGAVAVVGIGIAGAMSMGGKRAAPVQANHRRAKRGYHAARKSRYFVQGRAA